MFSRFPQLTALCRTVLRRCLSTGSVSVRDLEADAGNLDVKRAGEIYREHGCLVVRGLNVKYVEEINRAVELQAKQSIELLPGKKEIPVPIPVQRWCKVELIGLNQERKSLVHGVECHSFFYQLGHQAEEGWLTADGTLFIPAPEGSPRKEQMYCINNVSLFAGTCLWYKGNITCFPSMVLGVDYFTSSALLAASIDKTCLDIVEEILGPNIELFGKGQILYKEPSGGHAKFMHQDSAYFEFAKDGPVGTLNYCIDTTLSLDNGPLHVVPGSHRLGYIDHIDTHSHLALDPKDWPFNKGIPIEGKAGDTIFFHVNTIHGSMHNKSNKPRPVFINRYLRPDDYQLLQATSVKMRTEAKAKLAAIGDKFPTKDRGYMVRGWREYDGLDWTLAVAHH